MRNTPSAAHAVLALPVEQAIDELSRASLRALAKPDNQGGT
mgnify:CR=1 FL=1